MGWSGSRCGGSSWRWRWRSCFASFREAGVDFFEALAQSCAGAENEGADGRFGFVEDLGEFAGVELVDGREQEDLALGAGEAVDLAEDAGEFAGVVEGEVGGGVGRGEARAEVSSSWSGRMRRRRSSARFQVMRTSQTRRSRNAGSARRLFCSN